MDANNKVTVFLKAHDRLNTLGDALESLLKENNINIIVSDNSKFEHVGNFVKNKFPHVTYVRRNNCLDSESHQIKVLSSIDSEYFMVFHDDDILIKGAIKKLLDVIESDNKIAAVSGNAYILKHNTKTSKKLIKNITGNYIIDSPQKLVKEYISFDSEGVAPLSGYLYRSSKVDGIYPCISEGGKHNDISYLMKVVKAGTIIWIEDCIMYYRIHNNNDSNTENLLDRLSIIRYIKNNSNFENIDFMYYKFSFYTKFIRQNLSMFSILLSYRYKIILLFVICFGVSMVIRHPASTLKKLIYRISTGIK